MESKPNSPSLKKRYVYKLFTNFVALCTSLIVQMIVPRGLGAKAYGDYGFITNFFSQIIAFFDMATSTAFFTKMAYQTNNKKLVKFYFYFVCLIVIVLIGFVYLSFVFNVSDVLWPGQMSLFIICGALWGLLVWIVQVLSGLVDSLALTISGEKVKIIQKIVGVLLIVYLYLVHKLNLLNFFYYHYGINLLLTVMLITIILKNSNLLPLNVKLPFSDLKLFINDFYSYCSPLVVYSVFSITTGILDRWLLQNFSGSEQQGFYVLSYQIGSICALFTTAMTPLLLREWSIAHENNNIKEIAQIFSKYIPVLYSIAAYFACYTSVQALKVTIIFGGEQFKAAGLAVAIMALYPIHQTYGQLSGSLFYATGQTRIYRNIGVVSSILGVLATYVIIAPTGFGGLGAGAFGLATKMLILQFIVVNIQLYYNCRYLKLSFPKMLKQQFSSILILYFCAFVIAHGLDLLPIIKNNLIGSFIVEGLVYTIIIILIVVKAPELFGIEKDILHRILLHTKLIG